nr:hypothetical protein [Bacteroides acidifaciens]
MGLPVVKRLYVSGSYNPVAGDETAASVTACDPIDNSLGFERVRREHPDNRALDE